MDGRRILLSLVLGLVLGFSLVGVVGAQTGSGYDLTWWTVDGGGGGVGGGYTLMGAAGQPDAGESLIGGGYTLYSGFWVGVGAGEFKVYLPLVLR